MNTLNKDALNIIKSYEGLVLTAYPDPATKDDPIKKGEPWTIGYGTTIYPNGVKVKKGDKITEAQAIEYLQHDINTKRVPVVKSLVKKEINDNQFGALISFVYNLGEGNFKSSTLLKKINANPNDPSIADEFAKWNKANGKVLSGLTKRRKAEADLYFKK